MSNYGHDVDPNAPWLSDAHALCADHGIPPGHIADRIRALREKLKRLDDKAQPVAPDFDDFVDCEECCGVGFRDVERQVAERKSDVQTFREECEVCGGSGKEYKGRPLYAAPQPPAHQQVKTPLLEETLPYWEPCNPGCDPEFNGQRSRDCAKLCEVARAALAAQQARSRSMVSR